MDRSQTLPRLIAFIAGLVMIAALQSSAFAQVQRNWQRLDRLNAGTQVVVRTTQPIDINNADGRVFTGIVDEDVVSRDGRLLVPRGATVELLARPGPNNEVRLDLDSLLINGQRYAVNADAARVGTAGRFDPRNSGIGGNQETLEHIGGGALLGTILGAVVGGGKGAAIGAAAGAAVGAGTQIYTNGGRVSVPAESRVTFRLNRALDVGVADTGYLRDGLHYHRNYNGY